MTPDQLVRRYPRLYHMAEDGSWPQIKRYGLLSTTAILDLFEISGVDRVRLEERHRPEKAELSHPVHGSCVLRDQKPMPPDRLRRCLPAALSPEDWYRLLNGRVFFWTSMDKLTTLLGARAYRGVAHDVLTIDSSALLEDYQNRISLCRMNSGNTFPYMHPRDTSIFRSIAEYPISRTGRPQPEVVELQVTYAVSDIGRFVSDVQSMTVP